MQETHDDGAQRAAGSNADGPTWLGQDPKGVALWRRRDWQNPVGWLPSISFTTRSQETERGVLGWTRVDIPEFYLGHRAGLLLLQGLKLADLLVPNHEFVPVEGAPRQVAHVYLRVDAWRPHETPLVLRNLILASLDALPLGLEPPAVLDLLIRDALRPA